MNYWILIVSVLIGCAIYWPFFKYMYRVVKQNKLEFAKGYKQEFKSDFKEYFTGPEEITRETLYPKGSALRDETMHTFFYANLVVLLLPLIPAGFIAVPLYFLINWLFQMIVSSL